MSNRKWTHQTAEKVARCLADGLELKVSATVVRRLLGELDYSLKSNKKCLSSGNSPDRDRQFGIIKSLHEAFRETGAPIISVDTKKKELIGLFKNSGRTWCHKPKKVKDHDFRSEAKGLAAPYGIYDIQRNFGVLVVGQSADTPEFAVNCILTWWMNHGRYDYPNTKQLLILADSGGSNGARPRVWKKLLQERFSDQYGLTITVAHYPAGASKWNLIEHRMFNEISKNWAGKPLETFDTVVNFARKTTTKTGLRIEAYRDQRIYEKGQKVSDKEMDGLALTRNDTLGKWNYTIRPRGSRGSHKSTLSTKPQLAKRQSSPPQPTKAPSSDQNGDRRQCDGRYAHQHRAHNHMNTQPHGLSGANQDHVPTHASSSNGGSLGERRTESDRTDRGSQNRTFILSHLVTAFRKRLSSNTRWVTMFT